MAGDGSHPMGGDSIPFSSNRRGNMNEDKSRWSRKFIFVVTVGGREEAIGNRTVY